MTPREFPFCQEPDGGLRHGEPGPEVLLPGSFNPLHRGHRELAAAAARRLGRAVHFELSIANVDKPELDARELGGRMRQFLGYAPIWVTRAATFAAKAALFPGVTFVLGHDTAVRLIDPRYYGNDPARRDEALRKLRQVGCRVLVGGRLDANGCFREWDGAGLRDEFQPLFEAISAEEFRVDLSSTALRTRSEPGVSRSG